MRAVLISHIPVARIAVFAELAWLQRRPELGLLCRAAREHGNRLSVAGVQSALPGLSDAGAVNVLAWCRVLALCDEQGGLTTLGADVAERDEAPVPEQGVYGLWLAEHPVIGQRVLSVERLASNRDPRFESITALPIQPELGTVFRSVVDPKERFQVRSLPSNHGQVGCVLGASQANCRLRWMIDFDAGRDQWQLDGMVEKPMGGGKHAMVPMQHEPESERLDLWSLIKGWSTGSLRQFGRWLVDEKRLAVSFDELSGAEQDTFLKSLRLRRVEVPGKGSYDDVLLEDVPVGPASADDAQKWATARFERQMSAHPSYRSRSQVRALFTEVTEHTPLERFSPALPAHDALTGLHLDAPTSNVDRFWSLVAPVDLAPNPVSGDELEEFRVGGTEPMVATDRRDRIRLPYRSGWSMEQLVGQLLEGAVPRRVLLCDRYVVGHENLASLRLFVSAVRACAANAVVDVWTGANDAELKEVKAATGGQVRTYRSAFGQGQPHDRYVVIQPTDGPSFGWHLSNSPLHARADVPEPDTNSPLRWKDLAGSRVPPDELEPALRRWLEGGDR
jgi:hypothetical protein